LGFHGYLLDEGTAGVASGPTAREFQPDDPHFSLSFEGKAFYVVGLHPGSKPAGASLRGRITSLALDEFGL
jgi:hypothetical protein